MRFKRLSFECLERRDVPVAFNIPWTNPTAITLSFAPDGTNVDGSPSQLSAVMNRSSLSQSTWQNSILSAFQAWTSQANLNVGVVTDAGSPLGVSGSKQGDARFGDIRIFAAPLANNLYSTTVPPGDLGGTRVGDIILNSNYNFGVGPGATRDLYTVFLQEAGHALGLPNDPDTTSAMYEYYQGPRSGLSSGDVTHFQSLYGARPAATWEPATGNDSAANASPLAGTDSRLVYGDIASATDQDWYSWTASDANSTSLRVRVSGFSLLSARMTLFDANLNMIGSVTASGPGQDLTMSNVHLDSGAKYFMRVDAAPGGSFTSGQYRFRINANGPAAMTWAGVQPIDDQGTDDTLSTATVLDNLATSGAKYETFAHLGSNDVDVYRIHSPTPSDGQANVLTAAVRAFGDLIPQVSVADANGSPVDSEVVSNGSGLYTVVVASAAADADYYVNVQSQSTAIGDYELRAAFRTTATTAHKIESDSLTSEHPDQTGTLQVIGSIQMFFRLSALSSSVTLHVLDAQNIERFTLSASAGETLDGAIVLNAGSYQIVVTANDPSIATSFELSTSLLSDPIGVSPSDPNGPGDPPPPSGYNYYNDRGFLIWGERTPTGNG